MRWWVRPAVGALCGGLIWPLVTVITDYLLGDRPAPTAALVAHKAATGVFQGLAYGLIGNWLVARGRQSGKPRA